MYGKSRYKKVSAKKKVKKNKFSNLFYSSLIALLIISPVLILRSSLLKVKTIHVTGADPFESQKVIERVNELSTGLVFSLIPKKNILFIDSEELAADLQSEFSFIESIEIKKKFDKSLDIQIVERDPNYLWCTGDTCYNMDKNGYIFSRATTTGKLIFRGAVSGNPISKNFTDMKGMNNFLEAVKTLESAKIHTTEIYFELVNQASFQTVLGDVILNPEEDMSKEAQIAISLISDLKAKNPEFTFSYVDARFGNKVYYR